VLVRELAAGLLVGGLAAAQLFRKPRRPWLVAIAAAGAGYGLHTVLTSGHLVKHGAEIALLGTGGPSRAASMMGVALPRPTIIGPLLWAMAVVRLATDKQLRVLFALYVALPFTGFLVGRDYWGFMVAPFTIMWAGELLWAAVRHGREHMFDQTTTG
jgi:hypothetical protein